MPWDDAAAIELLRGAGNEPSRGEAEEACPQGVVLRYEYRGAQVVEARGDYDLHSLGPLADALKTATDTHPKVILDASGVTFADSSFLNLMILVHRTGKLRVAAPSAPVRRLCAITGVDDVLQIRETLSGAVGVER
ncbi:STAS domain-containing protein [Streptomyces roseolus]|uniref:STAS domain-containing protein n=1 Tax=Streptomyces roseolus TaxID=67358 RepID=UPI00167BA677|nr:STAS domain-containing protein [Streptomyces roseolus]GGR61027.1 anti-sigma factor antagonist [Streptomyces roseolus]